MKQTNYKLDLQMFAEETPEEKAAREEAERKAAEEEANKQSKATAVDVIKQLRENLEEEKSLRKKAEEENSELYDKILNGEKVVKDDIKDKPSVDKLREELYGGKVSLDDLTYISKTLELRKALMEEGKPDPFLPKGKKITPTHEDEESAIRLAEGLQHCVDYAEGDNDLFLKEIAKITI